MKNIVIILSGGKGTRFKGNFAEPKQYINLSGYPVIYYSVKTFNSHEYIDEILIVADNQYKSLLNNMVNKENLNKVVGIIDKGETRNLSTLAAINYYKNLKDDFNIIIHDAVRPFVDKNIIGDCIKYLQNYSCVNTATKLIDTCFYSADNNTVSNILDRSKLYNAQTPQGFKFSLLKHAYNQMLKQKAKIEYTDDCSVFKKFFPDEKIKIIEGSNTNFKITNLADYFLANQMIQHFVI